MDTQNNAAKFAFFYMLSLVALVFTALSSGMIIFQIINKSIIDILEQYSGRYSADQLKFAISALIISAPIFYITMRQIHKNLFSGALDKNSGIRKWLTYFILLVASVVMFGWLIGTINSFLDGELTMKFILKSITAIGISAAVFTFYFYDIRREEIAGKKSSLIRIYFYGSLAIVIAVFIASLFFVESPTETRNRKFDNNIISAFEQIDGAINTYYSDNQALPDNLDALKSEFPYIMDEDLRDPETKRAFEYNILQDNEYKLCATFRTANIDNDNYKNYYKDRWPHKSGYQCLSQKIRQNENNRPPLLRELK
ncbi:MAG: DUF5671 domain-containing protein [Patescibacteria group bacterium]|nr:DUF5671 domain-containing protein [Patescibacteria group bacterium]